DPERMRSLRIGDAVTGSSPWARSVRFGGFQIASNFATRPAEVTFPQPTLSGSAAVPTALDIYVNGQLRSQLDVPSGAFELTDIPVVTGAGQIQVVARDLLGREQIITQDFYASERLLRAGLGEYSLSVGRLRAAYAIESAGYGQGFVSGLYRRGLTERLTIEGRFESTDTARVGGFSFARTVGQGGLTSMSLARSNAGRAGTLWLVGHQYQGRRFRGDIRVQGTTAQFAQPGIEGARAFAKRQLSASAGISLFSRGSIGVSFVRERAHEGRGRRIASVSFSRSLPYGLVLSAVGSRVEAVEQSTEFSLHINRSLGPRASTSFALSRRSEGRNLRIDHRYELPAGPGYGYRTSIQSGSQDVHEAEFLMNTAFARYVAEYRSHDRADGIRLQTRGAIARFDQAWFPAREIGDGFAVVDAGGFDDVSVYLENRPIGRTRADGRLLVPALRPYESNRLRIESADLPLIARIDEPVVTVTPYFRSGAVASFGVRSQTAISLRALFADGTPVPEGSRASIDGGPFDYPVGLDGRLYLEGVGAGSRVEVLSGGAICTLDFGDLDLTDAFSNAGDIVWIGSEQSPQPVEQQ
ncbi:MAG: fimbria/pilus outer membrane usher protein, partial [Gammaproteobacteria bacterium]|nr:fimbria/pilus outer membrane usher protein [Gammaproteobacteria bacterium]